MTTNNGPYKACHTSKMDKPYSYGVDGPGPGFGYTAWYGYPQNTFATMEEAENAARLMNIAFAQGQKRRGQDIAALIGCGT